MITGYARQRIICGEDGFMRYDNGDLYCYVLPGDPVFVDGEERRTSDVFTNLI